MFSAPAQIRRNINWIQGQRFLMRKEKRFNVFSVTLWEKQKVIWIYLTPKNYQLRFIVSCLRPIKLSTLFSRDRQAFISVSRHFWSHHPNKAYLFLKGLPAKKKKKFSNSYSFPASKKIYFWFSKCKIWINFWFGLQNIKGLHHF